MSKDKNERFAADRHKPEYWVVTYYEMPKKGDIFVVKIKDKPSRIRSERYGDPRYNSIYKVIDISPHLICCERLTIPYGTQDFLKKEFICGMLGFARLSEEDAKEYENTDTRVSEDAILRLYESGEQQKIVRRRNMR